MSLFYWPFGITGCFPTGQRIFLGTNEINLCFNQETKTNLSLKLVAWATTFHLMGLRLQNSGNIQNWKFSRI